MSRPDTLSTHQARWTRALNGRMRWTREAWIDKLVRANRGWNPDELDTFWGQNREPSNYPLLHTTCEAVCGIEATTRRDSVILARTSQRSETAERLSGCVKYVDQQNRVDQVRSRIFRDAVDVGVGWLETFYQEDPRIEVIGKRRENPFHIWPDPTGREWDLADWQDLHRARWLPADWIDMRYERARDMSSGQWSPIFQYDRLSHTQDLTDRLGDEPPVRMFNQSLGGDPNYGPGHGFRAPLIGMGWATQDADTWYRFDRYGDLRLLVERWYRVEQRLNFVIFPDGRVVEPTPETARRLAEILVDKEAVLRPAIGRKMRVALFVAGEGGGLLQDVESPYPHDDFPFTPTWAYEDEEGQPVGLVRLLRDAAREYNMRRTFLTKISMMRQVHVEEGTFVDEDDAVTQLAKPNGVVRYLQGRLPGAQIQSVASMDTGMAQLQGNLLTGAQQMVANLGSVNQETLGQETNAESGRAIEERKQQSQVALYHLFDSRNSAQQRETEQTLALIQDSWTDRKEVRVTGTSAGVRYLQINQQDPDAGVVLYDIAQGRYDVIVDEQPESPTIRAQKLQPITQMFSAVQQIPPSIHLAIAVAMAKAQDLPSEIVQEIEKAQQLAEKQEAQPQQPPQQQAKPLGEVLAWKASDLTPSERAQALAQVRIQADPQGPPQPQPQQASPDAVVKAQADVAKQQIQQTHDQTQAELDRQHELNQLERQVAADRERFAQQAALADQKARVDLAKQHAAQGHDVGMLAAKEHVDAAKRAETRHHEMAVAGVNLAGEALADHRHHASEIVLMDREAAHQRERAAEAAQQQQEAPSPPPEAGASSSEE